MTKSDLTSIKNYLKVDHSYDDDLIKEMILVAELEIAEAISSSVTVEELKQDARFELAVKKQIKEHYEFRGDTADNQRFPIVNGVLPIIQQLRYRSDTNED
ncbi:head-tail connector protein [Vagococcus fessus]|uniref:DNA-packaging protein n=1 Tax=Vagococcus fessus TaxID=120370 RepID=A0A430A586_9ENTE|nr:head-tail connector protein [Vagococcus fessus]RSU01962.1 hypothetical protein CBF31_09350 [Vagococcus fessus]